MCVGVGVCVSVLDSLILCGLYKQKTRSGIIIDSVHLPVMR